MVSIRCQGCIAFVLCNREGRLPGDHIDNRLVRTTERSRTCTDKLMAQLSLMMSDRMTRAMPSLIDEFGQCVLAHESPLPLRLCLTMPRDDRSICEC